MYYVYDNPTYEVANKLIYILYLDGVLWKQVVTVWHAGKAFQNVGPGNFIVDFMVIVPICLSE